MTRSRFLVTLLTTVSLLSACSAASPSTTAGSGTTTPASTTTPATTAPITGTPGGQTVNYQVLRETPTAIINSVESLKNDRGYFYFSRQKILAVFMGERSTGGYSISLQDLRLNGTTLTVTVVETAPKPGEMVTQAFTYPLLLIQLDQSFADFDIKDQSGKAYPLNGGTAY